jgi:hypothetical protein
MMRLLVMPGVKRDLLRLAAAGRELCDAGVEHNENRVTVPSYTRTAPYLSYCSGDSNSGLLDDPDSPLPRNIRETPAVIGPAGTAGKGRAWQGARLHFIEAANPDLIDALGPVRNEGDTRAGRIDNRVGRSGGVPKAGCSVGLGNLEAQQSGGGCSWGGTHSRKPCHKEAPGKGNRSLAQPCDDS